MPRPPFSIGSGAFDAVELAAGIRFELVHDSLGSNLDLHKDVHMVGSDVRGQQVPATVRAMLLQGSPAPLPGPLGQALKHRSLAVTAQPGLRLAPD